MGREKDPNKQLIEAVRKRDVEAVKRLLEQKANPKTTTDERHWRKLTPLHLAAEDGSLEIAKLLLDHGANIAAQDSSKRTPLDRAADHGHPDVVKLLVERGADAAGRLDAWFDGNSGTNLLLWAVGMQRPDLVALAVKAGIDIECEGKLWQRPTHYAARNGDIPTLEVLLDAGADLEAMGYEARPPLFQAMAEGQLETALWLIERGANVGHVDRDGVTLLHVAAEAGHTDLVRMLLDSGLDPAAADQYDQTALYHTVDHGHPDIANMLLDLGMPLDKKGLNNRTILHEAAGCCPSVVARLLELGADITARNHRNRTPLHEAASYGRSDVIVALLDAGADIEAADNDGQTPLHHAVERQKHDAARTLIARGAAVDARANGRTPLETAVRNKDRPMMELLQEASPVTTGAGNSLEDQFLLDATARGDWNRVYLLVERARVDTCDGQGRTPLHLAAMSGCVDTIKLLLQHGADYAAVDDDGKVPADLAKTKKVKKLLEKPRRFRPGVEQIRRGLRIGSSDEEVAAIVKQLRTKASLRATVTRWEIAAMEMRGGEDAAWIVQAAKEAREEAGVVELQECACGRDTLVTRKRSVLHGNPASPAADTDVEFDCVCLSCGRPSSYSV